MNKPRIRYYWFGKYLCYDGDILNNTWGDTPKEAYDNHIEWKERLKNLKKDQVIIGYDLANSGNDYTSIVYYKTKEPENIKYQVGESLLTKIKRWWL